MSHQQLFNLCVADQTENDKNDCYAKISRWFERKKCRCQEWTYGACLAIGAGHGQIIIPLLSANGKLDWCTIIEHCLYHDPPLIVFLFKFIPSFVLSGQVTAEQKLKICLLGCQESHVPFEIYQQVIDRLANEVRQDQMPDKIKEWLYELHAAENDRRVHDENDRRLAYLFSRCHRWTVQTAHITYLTNLSYINALQSLLLFVPFQVEQIFYRCGFFQDCIDKDDCMVVHCLLSHHAIKNFYKDVVVNLLNRNSPIIRSEEMCSILQTVAVETVHPDVVTQMH